MKLMKTVVLLVAVVMSLSVVQVMAAESSKHQAQITVTFRDSGSSSESSRSSSSGGGSNGGEYNPSSRTSFTPGSGIETVEIIDPDIPLADLDLGELPKTGGAYLIPMVLVTLGFWMLYAVLRMEPKKKAIVA